MWSLRELLRNIYITTIGNFSKPSNGIHILNGHYVNKIEGPYDLQKFEIFIFKLSELFTFISFDEACEKIRMGDIPSKPCLSFSFDDGFRECYTIIAPILEKYNTNACFFINPSVIEKDEIHKKNFIKKQLRSDINKSFMTWFEISELQKRGHIIGNHTLNHTELNNLSFESAFDEVKSGKDELENKLGFKCKYFAIPFGTPDFFDQIGIKAALSNHEIIFTSSYDYGNYFYQNQRNILSRRHFEGSWEISHMKYFLSTPRKFH